MSTKRLKIFWPLVHISFWAIWPAIFLSINPAVHSRESFSFNVGDDVSVLSDKAFRKTGDNVFEAIGNVVITHYQEVLYGEKARFDMNSGDVLVEGNVRYVGPQFTIYGSKLYFNSKNLNLTIEKARIETVKSLGGYSVIGSKISRVSKDEVIAYDAEYTTCKDCPESWSVFGKKVNITTGEYIRIKNAFLKIKGVTVLYLPYVVFPIKKDRQTGLLFPKISFSYTEGMSYRQPFFWAISDQSDFTFSPGSYGSRGIGQEQRLRHVFGDQKWIEANGLIVNDRIYRPEFPESDSLSEENRVRHINEVESHLSFGHWMNAHARYNFLRDLDMLRDFNEYTQDKVLGSETGGNAHVDIRRNWMDLSILGSQYRNTLVDGAFDFDSSYVQSRPSINLSILPWNIWKSNFLGHNSLTTGVDQSYDVFVQNHYSSSSYIRNARRIKVSPYMDWQIANLGPLNLSSEYQLGWNHYDFFRNEDSSIGLNGKENNEFNKVEHLVTTKVSFTIEKIFGLAYQEKIDVDRLAPSEIKKIQNDRPPDEKFKKTIGSLPLFEESFTDDTYVATQDSYKHSQDFNFLYHRIPSERFSGSESFYSQIKDQSGLFDNNDAILSDITSTGSLEYRKSISKLNTFEIQWKNSIIKKSAITVVNPLKINTLRDHYTYSEIGTFNISQGYEFKTQEDKRFSDNLTRLLVEGSISISDFSFSGSEYYFYQNSKHVFSFDVSKYIPLGKVGLGVTYDSLVTPYNKIMRMNAEVFPKEILSFTFEYQYNLLTKSDQSRKIGLIYRPANDCWRLEIIHKSSEVDDSFSFNFLVNFANNNFVPLSGT